MRDGQAVAAQPGVHTALGGQHVDDAVVGPGGGAALAWHALCADVGAGGLFGLQGAEVTQEARWMDQGWEEQRCGHHDANQSQATGRRKKKWLESQKFK